MINEFIKVIGDVRVSLAKPGDTPDENLGIMDISDARQRAEEEETDLVLISEKSNPPVVKIVDAGKLRYQMELKKKANLKNSGAKDVKEVKLSYNIGVGDYDVRKNRALGFVKKGHRVKVTCQFRGREQQHVEIGATLLNKLADELSEFAIADRPKREGNRLSLFLKPREKK